jgi:EAL and modified HD-GYP domain-containing signal transduction protein
MAMDERVAERIEQMHAKGFTISINDLDLESLDSFSRYTAVLPYITYVKVNSSSTSIETIGAVYRAIKPYRVTMIVTKVEDRAMFDACRSIGVECFQGFFFSKPNLLESNSFDPDHMSIMRLCNMLMAEVDIDEIAEAFEQNHALTLQLIRFVNSAAFHFTKRIASVRQILTLLGRTPLTQWLLMMVYSKSVSYEKGKVAPILLMVKNRTELMVGLIKLIRSNPDNTDIGEAYLVGVLSLIETVFNVELRKILKELAMSENVEKALLEDTGMLAEMLDLVRSIEQFDISRVDTFVKKYAIDEPAVEALLISTIENVNSFDQSLKAIAEESA